ncbi:MAG: hypothetical protein QXR19_14935 [Candidatus Jordarchaeaceae archaeon]
MRIRKTAERIELAKELRRKQMAERRQRLTELRRKTPGREETTSRALGISLQIIKYIY